MIPFHHPDRLSGRTRRRWDRPRDWCAVRALLGALLAAALTATLCYAGWKLTSRIIDHFIEATHPDRAEMTNNEGAGEAIRHSSFVLRPPPSHHE